MKIRRTAIRSLVAALLLTLLARPSERVLACSCADPPSVLHAYLAADAVFAGTTTSDELITPFGSHAWAVAVTVDTVWKGDVPPTVYMVAGCFCGGREISDSCSWLPSSNNRNLVFATKSGDYFSASMCAGSEVWSPGAPIRLYGPLVMIFGPGQPPNQDLANHIPPAGVYDPGAMTESAQIERPTPLRGETPVTKTYVPTRAAYAVAFWPVSALLLALVVMMRAANRRDGWSRRRIMLTVMAMAMFLIPATVVGGWRWLDRYGVGTALLVTECGPVGGIRAARSWERHTPGVLSDGAAHTFEAVFSSSDGPQWACDGPPQRRVFPDNKR